MREEGDRPEGVEVANAWDLRPAGSKMNWIVGETDQIEQTSLRFVKRGPDGVRCRDVSMKVFVHQISDDSAWGASKPSSEGCTLSMLAGEGEFALTFTDGHNAYTVTLDRPNDFVIWGPGLKHSWRVVKDSTTIVTVRWVPERGDT
jgi:hypothetical protein